MLTWRCPGLTPRGRTAPARPPARSTGVRRGAPTLAAGLFLLAALTGCGDPDGGGGGGGGYVVASTVAAASS